MNRLDFQIKEAKNEIISQNEKSFEAFLNIKNNEGFDDETSSVE
jgi:hypothetical protein